MQIKQLRKRCGLTQQQVADSMGVVRNAISNWENEISFPKAKQIPQLADVLGCTIDALYVREVAKSAGQEERG